MSIAFITVYIKEINSSINLNLKSKTTSYTGEREERGLVLFCFLGVFPPFLVDSGNISDHTNLLFSSSFPGTSLSHLLVLL